jgi:hypothetical protein
MGAGHRGYGCAKNAGAPQLPLADRIVLVLTIATPGRCWRAMRQPEDRPRTGCFNSAAGAPTRQNRVLDDSN